MAQSFCPSTLPPTPISKFISGQPYVSMLDTQCSTMRVRDLKIIHAQLVKNGLAKDTIAASRVLPFTVGNPPRDLDYAYLIFTLLQSSNLSTWNTIIRAFTKSATPQIAISLFIDMLVSSTVEPHKFTYLSLFKAYSLLGRAHDGAQLHGRIIKQDLQSDPYTRNAIINMYACCGLLSEARKLFGEGDDMNVVAWNSMIIGFCRSEKIDEAKKLFDEMPNRTAISWNGIIRGYVRNGKSVEALDHFSQMQVENFKPTESTIVNLLNASARLGALKQGEWVHDYILKNNFELNVFVVTALIDMYCKCGNIEKGLQVFETAPVRGLACWNSIILGLAINGREEEALEFFSRLESSEYELDGFSFIGVLNACNNSDLVDKAREYFTLMTEKYKIEPSLKHYGYLVDVLVRAGLLEEAQAVIRSMPMNPDAVMWESLLSACLKHNNIELGQWAEKNLIGLDPSESCSHVLISNAYAASGEFEKTIQ